MAVKTELIARLLAQVKDLRRQLVRVVALLTALQIQREFRAVTIPPIKIPDWSSKPDQE